MSWEVTMLKNMHLVGEDENDDLYADFEQEYNPAFDTEVKFVFFVCFCVLLAKQFL